MYPMQIYHKINPNSLKRDFLGGLYKKFFIEIVGKFLMVLLNLLVPFGYAPMILLWTLFVVFL
jgi:hypothetical protein